MASRLAHSSSTYLRQHADNPVDWWAWGTEAFDEARRRDTPVLLSIGYASCHWCHVPLTTRTPLPPQQNSWSAAP